MRCTVREKLEKDRESLYAKHKPDTPAPIHMILIGRSAKIASSRLGSMVNGQDSTAHIYLLWVKCFSFAGNAASNRFFSHDDLSLRSHHLYSHHLYMHRMHVPRFVKMIAKC